MANFVKRMCSTATCIHCAQNITQGQPAWQTVFKKQKKFAHVVCYEKTLVPLHAKGNLPPDKKAIAEREKYDAAMAEMNR